jgi:hypothetical protein
VPNNKMSIARQRLCQHASIIVEAVFLMWPVPRSYKRTQLEEVTEHRTVVECGESSF